jgi:hypothetical protein
MAKLTVAPKKKRMSSSAKSGLSIQGKTGKRKSIAEAEEINRSANSLAGRRLFTVAAKKHRVDSKNVTIFRSAGTGRIVKPSLIPASLAPDRIKAAIASVLAKRD